MILTVLSLTLLNSLFLRDIVISMLLKVHFPEILALILSLRE